MGAYYSRKHSKLKNQTILFLFMGNGQQCGKRENEENDKKKREKANEGGGWLGRKKQTEKQFN